MTRVQDVMSTAVLTVSGDTSADVAWEMMRMSKIHHLVVMEDREVGGVVSDRDLAGARGAAVRKGLRVADLMTRGAVTVAPDTPVRKVANIMRGRSIGCLVVTAKGKVAGIVTVSDLLTLIGRGAVHPVTTGKARPILKSRAPRVSQNRPSNVRRR